MGWLDTGGNRQNTWPDIIITTKWYDRGRQRNECVMTDGMDVYKFGINSTFSHVRC